MVTTRTMMACVVAGVLAGCSSVSVVKNPGDSDTGIRYWRPKPFLLVTPADATGRMVKMKLEYLPDYSEEYSVHPKGKKPPQVQLKDGWNLVAVGGPAPPPEKAEEAAAPPPPPPADSMKLPEYVVAATNVPIGYYESVFDGNGTKKSLRGWRYVGLSPMGGGPAIGGSPSCHPNGDHPTGCPTARPSSIPGPLYGLVFFNGVMTFRQLDEIANNMTCPQYVKLIPDKPEPRPVSTEMNLETRPQGTDTEMKLEEAVPAPPLTPLPAPDDSALNLPLAPALDDGDAVAASPEAAPLDLLAPPAAVEDAEVTQASTRSKIPPPRVWATPGTGL